MDATGQSCLTLPVALGLARVSFRAARAGGELSEHREALSDWMPRPRHADADDLQEESLASIPDDAPGPEDLLHRADDANRVIECLRRLSEQQRRAIMLAFLYGMSHAEISAHLQQPLGTVKTWIRRGLQQLRRCLEEQQARTAALRRLASGSCANCSTFLVSGHRHKGAGLAFDAISDRLPV